MKLARLLLELRIPPHEADGGGPVNTKFLIGQWPKVAAEFLG